MPALEKFYFKKKGTVAPLEFLTEPVVHSTKWTTGSRLLPCFAPLSQLSGLASGPLDGVVHWLPAFALFCAFFPVSDRASGPLDKVVHWLLAFAPFCASFPSFCPSQWSTSS